MKKCVIIMNPESGKKKKITSYQNFYDVLRKYGYDTEIIFTRAANRDLGGGCTVNAGKGIWKRT